ncbi:hypothetical protein PSENEW3_00004455 [Picochlorum sp. SENEW3]|nr:hypothetical protein PSENEW3_00004455 [Picochlorum sp. SENEW3]
MYIVSVLLGLLFSAFTASAKNGKEYMNRSCRYTWICNDKGCLGKNIEPYSNCDGSKNCKSDLENWVLAGARKQWGKKAVHWKARYNLEKERNWSKMWKEFPWLKRDIIKTIKDVRKYGYKVKYNPPKVEDIVSRVCVASSTGRKKGMNKRTMLVSLNPNAVKYPTGDEKTRTYFRAYSVKGRTDGFVSAKKH